MSWGFASSNAVLRISVSGSRASGTWTDGKSGRTTPFSGSISGSTLTFSYVAQDGSHGTAVMSHDGMGSAQITFSAIGITFSGVLVRG